MRRINVPTHVLARSVGDDTVLLDLHKDEYFALDHVGTKAWSLIAAGAKFDAIVDDIAESYGVDRSRVERDVEALLDALVASGLLVEG